MSKGKRNRNRAIRQKSPKERIEFAIKELRKKRGYHKDCISRIDKKISERTAELEKEP